MNHNLTKLFQKKAYWKKEKSRNLGKLYHNAVLPWIIAAIGSLIWLIMDWGVLALWFWIVLGVSSAAWSIYWMIEVKKCSNKIALINKEIAKQSSKT